MTRTTSQCQVIDARAVVENLAHGVRQELDLADRALHAHRALHAETGSAFYRVQAAAMRAYRNRLRRALLPLDPTSGITAR